MNKEEIVSLVQSPDMAAKKMGYYIDWSNNETVRESLSKMDLISYAVVKSVIENTALILGSIDRKDLEMAGITDDSLLKVAGGR